MGKQKSSLTEWPEDLKDVIDWFLRVGEMDPESNGYDKKSDLSSAVGKLQDYSEAQKILESTSIPGLFNAVANGLQTLIGYNSGNREMTDKGIGLYTYPSYTSSYSNQAAWSDSSSDPTTYAHILLGSFPLLYFGLTYLFWRCGGRHVWQNQTLQGGEEGAELHEFMNYMGYYSDKLSNTIKGHQIAKLLGSEHNAIEDLKTLYSSISPKYPDFLQELHQKGAVARSVMDFPFYKLYAASSKYLQSKVKPSKIMELPQTKSDIAKTLKGYSEAVKKLEGSNTQQLSKAYTTLLSKIEDVFHPDPSAPKTSSGGAAVGGLLGVGTLGAGAAYGLNLGGLQTTINGLLQLR